MSVRRVVAGVDEEGRAIVASDETVEGVELMAAPGALFTELRGADAIPSPPARVRAQGTAHLPPPGGFRFTLVSLPPRPAPPSHPTCRTMSSRS